MNTPIPGNDNSNGRAFQGDDGPARAAAGHQAPAAGTRPRASAIRVAPLMFAAGMVSGLLGIGSGVLKVPAMDIAMKLPMKVSTATSNFMIGVTAAASAGVYFVRGDINPFIAAPVAMGVLIGATAGTRLMMRARSTVIRRIFVVVLLAVAAQMLWKGVRGA